MKDILGFDGPLKEHFMDQFMYRVFEDGQEGVSCEPYRGEQFPGYNV